MTLNSQYPYYLKRLPASLREQIKVSPKTGSGVHNWLFRTALKLHDFLKPPEIYLALYGATRNCGRHVPYREINAAINDSAKIANRGTVSLPQGANSKAGSQYNQWPETDRTLLSKIVSGKEGVRELASRSRNTHPFNAEAIIDHLFPPEALICCGTSSFQFCTAPRREWCGHLRRQQFIVPNPMTSRLGKRKDGTGYSAHTLDNTGERRFLVVEFDHGDMDQQAALHLHLSELAPLTMVVHSGSKSLHGWYACAGVAENKLRSFFRYACRVGADPRTWTRSQFVRMPWGIRPRSSKSPETTQVVLYFNPHPTLC